MRNSGRFRFIGIAALAWVLATASAWAEPVAMVTDLSGGVEHDGTALEILAELEPGTAVSVAEQGRVSIVYYADGSEYTFQGPARFEVAPSAPKALSGAAPKTDSVLPEGEGSISTVGLAQAAMVMRASPNEPRLTLVYPVETVLLSPPESFEWRALEEGVGYSFELTDPEGRSLMETTVTGTRLAVPEHIALIPGEYYTWSLETRLPDGRKFSNWASFSVADDVTRNSVETRRPSDRTNVSRLVLFALWLEQNEFVDEARKYWDMVHALRPEAANVAARLGEAG